MIVRGFTLLPELGELLYLFLTIRSGLMVSNLEIWRQPYSNSAAVRGLCGFIQ